MTKKNNDVVRAERLEFGAFASPACSFACGVSVGFTGGQARELRTGERCVVCGSSEPVLFPSRLPRNISEAARRIGLTRKERRELLAKLQHGEVGRLTGRFAEVWNLATVIREAYEER